MIITAMELCTSNLTQRTAQICEVACKTGSSNMDWPAMSMASYPEGWFMAVPERQYIMASELPEDLFDVLIYARDLGVNLIRFDRDAEPDTNLPTYDW